ncbi:MAG: beta-galactosidase, partial [Trebonia sp.]
MSHRERQVVQGIGYGGDYNPEQWPESTWAEDIRLMTEAGVNLVTVGVFSWSRLQPAPGDLTAGWLDRVLDLLAGAGIGVDLATGTASPPPWLVAAHPEILPVTADGTRLAPGARQHYCPSAPAFRAAAVDLAARMARRYADHPAVTMWHLGNEYGSHFPACYCELSADAFRSWLRARYGELGRLNAAWGGAVWSQDYTSWDQVQPPRTAPTYANPAQQLDFARFSSGELLACYRAEREAVAAHSPATSPATGQATPVTTNFMSLFRPVDQFRWAAELDVVSVDSYPDPADPEAHLLSAMTCDLTRSVGGGRPWVLMEQAPNAVNWRAVNVTKAPGQYRALSLQAVARGADAVLSFQWRAAAAGAEKFHSGMLPHAGTDSRVWREVTGLGADLGRLAPVAGRPVRAEVALLLDWESWWALELDSHPSRLHLVDLLREFYRPLFGAGVNVGFAHPESDLSGYRLVLVPALYLVSDAGADNLRRFAADGGTVVVSFFSAIVDPSDRIRLGGYPAPWRDLLGLRVEELAPLPEGASVRLDGAIEAMGGVPVGGVAVGGVAVGGGRVWQDAIDLRGAEPLLRYATGHLAGRAAATRHPYGRGEAFYLGTLPDRATLRGLVERACRRAGVEFGTDLPPGVEAVRRGDYRFVISHLDHPVDLDLGGKSLDLLTSDIVGPAAVLGPRGALVLTARDLAAVPAPRRDHPSAVTYSTMRRTSTLRRNRNGRRIVRRYSGSGDETMVAKQQPAASGAAQPQPANPVTESFRTELTQGEESIDAARWAGGIEDVRAIAPRIRVGRDKWFNILWLLPIGFVALISLIAIGKGLRGMPAVERFIVRYPGEVLPSHALADAGIPSWVNWQHFFNLFFMFFIIRSGWQILCDHPRLYWTRHSRPGGEWLRIAKPAPDDPLWTAKQDSVNLPRQVGLPGLRHSIGLARWWHFVVDLLFLLNGLVFYVLLFITPQWQRLVPTSWAVFPNALSVLIQYLSLNWPLNEGWVVYNSMQLLAYFITVFVAAPLALVTGLGMSPALHSRFPRISKMFSIQLARTLHFFVMVWFVTFIVMHVTLVFTTGMLRNLNAMFAGRDSGDWVGFGMFCLAMTVVIATWVAASPFTLRHPRVIQRVGNATVGWFQRSFEKVNVKPGQFTEKDISPYFWHNGHYPDSDEYRALMDGGFVDYRLRIDGLVENPVELDLAQLRALPHHEQITQHYCIQGWSGVAKWGGVSMSTILDLVRPRPDAKWVVFYSIADGSDGGIYYDAHPIAQMRGALAMLAYEFNGKPLTYGHGAPLRLR